jgi:hypothetical protein
MASLFFLRRFALVFIFFEFKTVKWLNRPWLVEQLGILLLVFLLLFFFIAVETVLFFLLDVEVTPVIELLGNVQHLRWLIRHQVRYVLLNILRVVFQLSTQVPLLL